ncbi:MAG: PfkB family carbohydrate kinase [Bacteroidota bacterium]
MNRQIHTETPELLCIGFLCHDLHEGKKLLGGTAAYASLMASHLGVRTALLTSVGKDFAHFERFRKHQVDLCNVQAEQTTVFENVYTEEGRTQYMHQRAQTLYPKHLPTAWQDAPVVKFCLIADEADLSFLDCFPHALVGATIQGWLRQWDGKGRVSPREMDWEMLRFVNVVFMSEDDIRGCESAIPRVAELVDVLIVTRGKKSALIHHNGQVMEFPVFPTKEVDPTGAGDIFASSFLVKYHACGDILSSVAFAHAAASFVVEEQGIRIAEVAAIEKRCVDYLQSFGPRR